MKYFLWAFVFVLVLVSGCGQFIDISGVSPVQPKFIADDLQSDTQYGIIETVMMQPSWAYSYSSMEDLINRSDLIVVGKVTRILSVENASQNEFLVLPITHYEFTVDKVLADADQYKSGSSITVYKTGGVFEGKDYQLQGYPPYNPGEQVILFLKEGEPADSYYAPPQGRFLPYFALIL